MQPEQYQYRRTSQHFKSNPRLPFYIYFQYLLAAAIYIRVLQSQSLFCYQVLHLRVCPSHQNLFRIVCVAIPYEVALEYSHRRIEYLDCILNFLEQDIFRKGHFSMTVYWRFLCRLLLLFQLFWYFWISRRWFFIQLG